MLFLQGFDYKAFVVLARLLLSNGEFEDTSYIAMRKQSAFVPNVMVSVVLLMTMDIAVAAEPLEIIIKSQGGQLSPNETKPESAERSRVLPSDGGEFLRQLNGVSASRFGGRGLEPVIRGQSQTQLNVLLDGAYVHGGCPNRMDPPASWAALETYERVKVEKGVQTLQHGSGGSGGTVLFERDTQVLTNPDGGIAGKVSATAMTNGVKHDVLADVVVSGQKGYARAFVQDRDADNYSDGDGSEVRSSYQHRQAGLVVGVTPAPDRVFEYSIEHNDFADALYPGSGMDSPTEKGDIHRLKYKDVFTNKAVESVEAELYVSDIEHVMDNFSLRPANPMMLRQTDTTSKTTGGKVKLTSHIRNTELTYGVNIQNRARDAVLRNMNNGQALNLMWPGVSTNQSGFFAEAETQVPRGGKFKYGVRVDRVEAKASKANQIAAGTGRTANQNYQVAYGVSATNQAETNVGALLRYEYPVNEATTLFAGVSRTVRTADESERFMSKWGAPGTRWLGNPAIKPEKHHQLDVGISQRTPTLRWGASGFVDKVDDFILRDTARGQAGINLTDNSTVYRNVDATLAGVELEADMKLGKNLTLSGDVAYVRRVNDTDNGRVIAQTPPLNGKVQLDYDAGSSWAGGARVRFAKAQNNVDLLSSQEVGVSPGYGVMDIYGRYQMNKATRVRFGVDNVLDKTYANHLNRADNFNNAVRVNEPGRTAWLKLEADF